MTALDKIPRDPAKRLELRQQWLAALLLHLVKSRPGLTEAEYAHTLHLAINIEDHCEIMSIRQLDQVLKYLPDIHEVVFRPRIKVRYRDLWTKLQELGYLHVTDPAGKRSFKPANKKLGTDHLWMKWPVPRYAKFVYAIGKAVGDDNPWQDLELLEV